MIELRRSNTTPITVTLLALLVLSASSSCRAASSPAEIGRLDFDGDVRTSKGQILILYGHKITGQVVATFLDGTAYLNGRQWLPAPTPHIASAPAQQYSDQTKDRFGRIPYVKRKQSAGMSLDTAIASYMNAMDATINVASQTYDTNLHLGAAAATEKASGTLDTVLAETNPKSKRAPRFGKNGAVAIFFHGFGWFERAGRQAASHGKPTARTEQDTRNELALLRKALRANKTVLIAYSRGTRTIITGAQAEQALAEVASLHTSAVPVASARHLPDDVVRELQMSKNQGE